MTDSGRLPSIHLLAGRDRRVAGGHPWAYSNEVRMDAEAKALPPGNLVTLRRVDGKPLGTGTFNPHALIAFRRMTAEAEAQVDAGFLAARLDAARGLRERLFDVPHYRLVHAEADGLPGLIVDRYGDVAVVQANTAGMERLLPEVLDALERVLAPRAVALRNDSPARRLEGLEAEVRIASGSLEGAVEVRENRLFFLADPRGGQKTGWFFDQRDNRAFVARLARGRRVLDLYSYTGGFAVTAAAAGAERVLAIDRSEPALALGEQAAARNRVADRCTFRRGDVFAELAAMEARGETFDVVVADPPAFAKAKKDVPAARRGYRKLARLAAGRVSPGGVLFMASCSHNMAADTFAEEVVRGTAQAGRTGRILRAAGAGPDHPVHPHLPETAYLKALTLQLD